MQQGAAARFGCVVDSAGTQAGTGFVKQIPRLILG
jgi:hypothetical protein